MRGRLQLRTKAVTDPDLGLGFAQHLLDRLATPDGRDEVVGGLGRLEDPLPLVAAIHPRSGLVAADDWAGPDGDAYLLILRLWLTGCSAGDVGNSALADREPKEVAISFCRC